MVRIYMVGKDVNRNWIRPRAGQGLMLFKLWAAYDELNRLRAKYPSAKIAARPECPFY